MSILGDMVGITSRISRRPVAKKRARMSLRLLPTTSWEIARPMRCAAYPAKTLPKLPLGTAKDTGARRPAPPSARAATT